MARSITLATPADCPDILDMIIELATFEKMADQVAMTVPQLQGDLSAGKFSCAICRDEEGTVIGYGMFVYAFDLEAGRLMYLEDLYVREKHRGKGVGSDMWDWLVSTAKSEGCASLEFSVLSWNITAIPFYVKRGARNLTNENGTSVLRYNVL